MKKMYKSIYRLFSILLLLVVSSAMAQVTVTITATGTTGSYATGSVNAAGTKNDGNMITINSTTNRGWAHFDLSTIPAGSTIVSANALFTTYTSTSSAATNNLYGFTGDPASIAGATLYTNCGSGTSFNASTWTANALNTKALNATGTAFLAANFGGSVNIGYVRGSTNTYNIGGYPGAPAAAPQLSITYIAASACSGTPAPGAVTATPSSVNIAQSFTLSLPGIAGVTGFTYQWQSSPDGVSYTNIAGATSGTYTGTESATTFYQCIVTCTASGISATATPVQVVLNPVLNMTNGSASVCSVNFYDSGGSAGAYLNNENYTLTLYPATAGASLQVLFNTFAVETCCDNLTIYNGNSTAAPLIGTYTASPGTVLSTAVDGSLTFVFHSDGSVTAAGWDATVSCILGCTGTPVAGTSASTTNPVCSGNNFTLSLTGAVVSSGLTYQWQSSPDGVTYTNIAGATAATYTGSQTAATYYQCVVTCSGSGLSSTSTPLQVTMNSFINCYCASAASFTADEEIYSVTVNGATNAYDCVTPAPGPGSVLNQYSNFTTLPALTSVMQGQSVNFTILEDECDGATYYSNGAAIWIDFNQNGSFADAGEQVYVEATTTVSPRTITGSFIVPIGATVGNTRMRITVAEGYSGAGLTPCLSYGYGETEDYLVNITATTACTGTPNAGTTTASASSVCAGTPVSLSLSGADIASGLTYQWQSSGDGVTYTNIAGATSSAYSTTQTVATYYQCVMTCTSSGLSSISVPVQVNMNSFLTCYCNSAASSSSDEDIFNVTLGSLNNTSSCATTGGAGSVLNMYSDYTTLVTAPVLAQTASYPLSVQVGTCGGNYTNSVSVYIDYNQNGLFTDPGENVYVSAAGTVGPHTETGTILIPGTALAGTTRMRVIDVETGTPSSITPCGTYLWGETEDYYVTIAPLPATPPTPVQDPSVPSCATGTQLTVPGTAPSGETWYWQTTATGTSTTNPVSGPYTVFVNGTYYVNSYNASYNIWSASSSSVTVTNIPLATTPPAPTAAASPACLNTTISMSSPASGIGYFWQGTNSTGSSNAQDASTPYSVTASGTYYVAAYDSATSCWSATSSVAVVIDTYVPAAPTSTVGDTVCQGVLSSMISAVVGGSGSTTTSFGTAINSPGPATTFNITVPAMPAGATVTSTTLVLTDATAIGSSWQSEIRVALSGSTTLAATQISTVTTGGTVTPNPYTITVPNVPVAGGPVTLTLSESFDDGGVDATFSNIQLVVTYTLPPSTLTWWNASTAGALQGSGSPFETVGTGLLPTTNTPGTYTFYAAASSGSCSSTRVPVDVLVNPLPIMTLSDTTICTSGAYTVDAQNAGSAYLWNTSATTQSISVSTNGLYYVDITNTFGCAARDSVNIVLNALPFVDLGVDASFCAGDSITFDAGNTGFNFLWNTGSTNQTINATTTGTYYVGVTNPSTGCVNYDSVNLVVNPLPVIALGVDTAICAGDSLLLDAGNAGANYLWNDASTNQTLTVNTAGNYSVLVMNPVTTCYSFDTIAVAINALPTVNIGADTAICSGTALTLDAGNAGSTYAWSDASTAQTLGVSTAGTYSVALIDPNGCHGADTITVAVNALPVVNIGPDSTQCGGSILMDAGNVGDNYLWSDASTAQTLTATTTGNYYVDVTNANGCTSRDSALITINLVPVVNLGADTVFCGTNILLDAGNPGLSYAWSNSTSAQTLDVFISGSYSVAVTDTLTGCNASDAINITINTIPSVNLGADTTQCGGVITLDAGTSGSTFLWNTGATSSTLTVSSSASYYVAVTGASGCTANDTIAVTIHTLPAVGILPFTTPVCLQATPFMITNGTPSGGVYSGTGVSSGTTFDPSVAGIGVFPITYTITDGFSCSNSATQNITVHDCAGVEEYNQLMGMTVYPNPSSGSFTVAITDAKYEQLVMSIVNIQGKEVYNFTQKNLNGDFIKEIQLGDLAKGIYFIRITADAQVKVEKLIIQ